MANVLSGSLDSSVPLLLLFQCVRQLCTHPPPAPNPILAIAPQLREMDSFLPSSDTWAHGEGFLSPLLCQAVALGGSASCSP